MNLNIAEAAGEAAAHLGDHNIRDARRDASLLLQFVLRRDKTFLIAHDDYVLSDDEQNRFLACVRRRTAGEPVQYITGRQEFWGLDFEVNSDVLIPRPETEIMVEAAVDILGKQEEKTFCDVGTGSGCIPIAILHELKSAHAVAVDISPAAIQTARRNAEKNQVADRIEFVESNVFDAFKNQKSKIKNQKFTVVVSNPPYIPNKDLPGLPREVRGFEPHVALFGGDVGTEIVGRLLDEAADYLFENGFLLFEIGFTQGEAVRGMIDEKVWRLETILDDLQGIPRIVVLQKI